MVSMKSFWLGAWWWQLLVRLHLVLWGAALLSPLVAYTIALEAIRTTSVASLTKTNSKGVGEAPTNKRIRNSSHSGGQKYGLIVYGIKNIPSFPRCWHRWLSLPCPILLLNQPSCFNSFTPTIASNVGNIRIYLSWSYLSKVRRCSWKYRITYFIQ